MQHYKSPPFHPKAVTPPLRALVLLLMQTAEQDKIATQSMGDDYIQRCTIFNEDNWRWVTVCSELPFTPLSTSQRRRQVLWTPVPQRTPVSRTLSPSVVREAGPWGWLGKKDVVSAVWMVLSWLTWSRDLLKHKKFTHLEGPHTTLRHCWEDVTHSAQVEAQHCALYF